MAVMTQVSKPVALARLRWVLGQVLVVAVGVFVYFRIRGITDASVEVAHAHAGDIVRLERWLGLDVEARCPGARRIVGDPGHRCELGLRLGPLAGHPGDHGLAGVAPSRRLPAPA